MRKIIIEINCGEDRCLDCIHRGVNDECEDYCYIFEKQLINNPNFPRLPECIDAELRASAVD